LYSKFRGTADDKPALVSVACIRLPFHALASLTVRRTASTAQSVEQLTEMLPDYKKEKIEILLDTLVSRRLLRPFVVEGTMFWQRPL
jgi:hypothetical protein